MTTTLVETAADVNHFFADRIRTHSDAVEVDTLADRISWILESRNISERELARRSGMSEPSIGVMLTRLREHPSSGVTTRTLQKLARGAAVSIEWLATGQGTPDGRPWPEIKPAASGPEKDDPYPTRALVLHALRNMVLPEALEWVRSAHPAGAESMTEDQWIDEVRRVHRKLSELRREFAEPTEGGGPTNGPAERTPPPAPPAGLDRVRSVLKGSAAPRSRSRVRTK